MNLRIETERLLLRPFELSDAKAMFIMDSNPAVHQYLWQKPVIKIEDSIELIKMVQEQYERNQIGRFATILKDTNEFIGWTGIKFVDNHFENGNTNFYDYGYRLNEPYWSKGYATEATYAWIKYAFNVMNVEIMHAYTHSQNNASNHILRKTGYDFVEKYTAEDGTLWNWWKIVKNKSK